MLHRAVTGYEWKIVHLHRPLEELQFVLTRTFPVAHGNECVLYVTVKVDCHEHAPMLVGCSAVNVGSVDPVHGSPFT
jgi:hypothetical protein